MPHVQEGMCPVARAAGSRAPPSRRLGEGQVLVSVEEVEQVGYSFLLITREM